MEAPNRNFINTYLDAPILEGEMRRVFYQIFGLRAGDKPTRNTSPVATMLYEMTGTDWDIEMYDPYNLPAILRTLPDSVSTTGVAEAWSVAHSVWKAAQIGFQTLCPDITLPKVPTELPVAARAYYSKAELFVRFIERLALTRSAGKRFPIREETEDGSLVILGDQYCCGLLYPGDATLYVCPYEVSLMFKDMLLARGNVHLGLHLIYHDSINASHHIEQALAWEEECLYRYGNRGYEVLKSIEALTKAYVIHTQDPVLGGHDTDVLARLTENVRAKERGFGATDQFQADSLIEILQGISDVRIIVEVFGLQKLTGHPVIDPRTGGASAAEEASRPSRTTWSAAVRLRNNWCRMYLEGYVKRQRRWPDLHFPRHRRHTQLYQLYKIRDRHLKRDSYPLEDWNEVRFGKHHEFDYYTNFTDLMDDRSISFYRDEFRATWRKNIRPRSQRRLLLEMLDREEISIREIIAAIERDEIPESWLIVSLYPKEREFKLAARMFSMMVFEMRVFFASLEANLADHVFPNLPQQTMTLSRNEILSRFFHLSKPLTTDNRERLYIEVDLTRWNLRWRDMAIRMIGQDLNDMFGVTKRYTFVHEFFRSCMILVRVAGYEPEGLDEETPPQSSLLWYDHEGGFEGIAQKHWSIATYSMIDIGMEPFPIEYSIAGQADNQVVLATVTIPQDADTKEYLFKLAGEIKQAIAESCARVGQEAKEEECLESTNVVTYSKDFYINGSEYFLSLKAVSRIFPRGASDFPTVANGVASVTSTSVAAAEKLKQPLLGYFLGLFHTARFLIRVRSRPTVEGAYVVTATRKAMTTPTLVMLLSLPGSFGGLPIPTVCTYLYKGGGDPGSKDYMSMKILYLGGITGLGRVNKALLTGAWKPAELNKAQLLEDPYSIPIRRAATAENRVLDISLMHMKQRTRNRAIKDLINASVDGYDEELQEALMAVTPFNPILLSDVRSFSIVGAREMAVRMFTITRTVQSLTHGSETDPGAVIMTASARELKEVISKLSMLPATRLPFGEVYSAVEQLRHQWDPDDQNPVVGVTSYHPLDWEIVVDNEASMSEGVFLAYIPNANPWHNRGGEAPYLGTDTIEKRSQHGFKIITSSAAEKAYARLALIATQPGVDASFRKLIHHVAETRSSISLEDLLPYLSRAVGGSIAHRYQSVMGNRGASVLGCGTFASHLIIDSNHAGVLSASLADHPVMFQEIFSCGIGLLNLLAGSDPIRPWMIRFKTPPRIEALPDELLTAKSRPSSTPIYPDNPIAYCHELTLMRVTRPTETAFMTPLSSAAVASLSPEIIAYHAAYRQLLNRHTAHLIADLGFGAVRLPLDLLEYRGIGLRQVVRGVAVGIARFTVDAMFSRSYTDLRWNPLPLIKSLAESFGGHLQRAARHPLFRDDPYAREYFSSSGMAYNGKTERSVVVGLLVTDVLVHLEEIDSQHLNLEELVFDDDAEDVPLLRAESLIKRAAIRAVLRGEIDVALAYRIARNSVVAAVRQENTVGGKLNGLYRMVCSLANWAAESGFAGLTEDLSLLAEGRSMLRVFRTQVEVVRATRGRAAEVSYPWKEPDGYYPEAQPERPVISGVHEVNTVSTWPESSREDPDFLAFSLRRRYLRVYGTYAPAAYTYWPIRSLFRHSNVVILGSGLGGALNVAVYAQATTVLVHDIQDDIDPRELACPMRKSGSTVITRSTAGYFGAHGDLHTDETWTDLQAHLAGPRVIVLDVPCSWPEFQRLTSRLSSVAYGSLLVTRWIYSKKSAHQLYATWTQTQGWIGAVPVFEHAGYRETLAIFRIDWSGSWGSFSGTVVHDLSSSIPDYEGISSLGGGIEWNNMAYRQAGYSVSAKVASLSEEAIGKDRHSFTYDQWSDVLLASLGTAIDRESSWVETVVDIVLRQDTYNVKVGEVEIMVAITPAIRRWLLTSYPRTRPRMSWS